MSGHVWGGDQPGQNPPQKPETDCPEAKGRIGRLLCRGGWYVSGMSKYSIVNGWLCEAVEGCTCGTGAVDIPHKPTCGVVNVVKLDNLVESVVALTEALDRVREANEAWYDYAGNPAPEFAREMLAASEAVRLAVVALTGGES